MTKYIIAILSRIFFSYLVLQNLSREPTCTRAGRCIYSPECIRTSIIILCCHGKVVSQAPVTTKSGVINYTCASCCDTPKHMRPQQFIWGHSIYGHSVIKKRLNPEQPHSTGCVFKRSDGAARADNHIHKYTQLFVNKLNTAQHWRLFNLSWKWTSDGGET